MKKDKFLAIFAFTILSLSVFAFISCKEKKSQSQVFESPYALSNNYKNFEFPEKSQNQNQNLVQNKVQNQTNKSSNISYVTFTNKTESPIVSVLFYEKNKKSSFKTVYIEKNQSQVFEFKKNVPYKVELIDDKNHHYCKKISNGNDLDSFFNFEMDNLEIEYTDKDFAPQNLSDFVLKFLGL